MDAVSRACVGVGLLRKGKVVRVGTGACVDVSGLIATANHNVDRLLPGDQIVVAVPAEGRIQLEVPAIGTYGYDVNERVGLGELRAFEKSRWRWTHLALVVIETLHHELDDALGAQGLDIALIRICNRVEVLRRPGDDKRECEVTDSDASPASSPTTPELKSPSDEEDAEEEPPLATRVLPLPVFGWELTRSLHSPFTRHHAKTSSGNRSSKAAGGNAMADRYPGTILRVLELDPDEQFTAVALGNSDVCAGGTQMLSVGFISDCESAPTRLTFTLVPPERASRNKWMFGEPELISTRTAGLSGCPVFVEAGGYFTGLMISSNVPYKLASDKAFFENWVPVDTVESAAAARLPLGFQPIRPSNVVSTLVSVALKRLPKLMRSHPRASWLPTPHAGTVWLNSVLAPYDASDTRLAAVAEQCHRATRSWIFDDFERWCVAEFQPGLSRVFRIRGPSGIGKSAICAQLCCQSGGRVLGWHFCNAAEAHTCSVTTVLTTLSFQLACKFPPYLAALRARLSALCPGDLGSASTCRMIRLELERMQPIELFNTLFLDTLSGLDAPSTRAVVLLIDGLDTATTFSANPFLQIIRNEWPKLPRWMGLVISCLPHSEFHDISDVYCKTIFLEQDQPNNKHDVESYVTAALRHCIRSKHDLDQASKMILSKSQGLMLYAGQVVRSLVTLADGGQLDFPTDIRSLPHGIGNLFAAQLRKAAMLWISVNASTRTFVEIVLPLLHILSVAQQELTVEELFAIASSDGLYRGSLSDVAVGIEILSRPGLLLRITEFNQGDAVVRSIRVGSIAFACWVADPAQNTVLPVDSKRAHRMLARACLHTINTACTALEVRAAKDRLSRVMPLDPISPLLGYAISHTLTHLRVLQHFRHLSAVLSRASYLCLRACVGPRSANAIVPDFIAAIEHLSEFAGTSSAAPADKETSLVGPPAPLPVIGVSTIRLYNQDVVGSGDGAGNHEDVASAIRGAHRLHLYHRFFDANKAVLASEPDRLFPIVWELDPTNPVRVRTRQQVLRACQRASSKPETDPAFAESDDEAEQDDVSEVDSSSSDVTDSLSEGETESDSSSSSHSSPSRISGSNSHPASLARDSDATSDSDADAATPIRRVLPPSRTISSPTRPPSIALQSTSKMLSTLRQHTGAASTTQPLPAATAVSLSRTIRGAVAAEPVVIPRDAARVLSSHTGWVNSVAVSDDGRRLVSCGADNTVRVWQPNTGTLLCTLEPGVHTTQLSKSGVTQCDARRLVSLWSVSLSGDGVTVAAGGEDCTVYVWNTESGRLTWSLGGFEGHSSWIACVALDTPGSAVLSSGRDSLLRHWSLDTGRLLHAYKGHTGTIWSCAFIDSGRYAVSSGADGTCRIWDVDTGSAIAVFSVCKGDVFSVTASSLRPGVVVCGGWDGRVSAWDWTHQELMWEHFGHKDESGTATAVRSVWMSEDGRFVFSGSDDGVVGRVDAENGEDMVSLRGHAGPVTGVMSSFDGLHLFSGGRDGTVRVWTFT